MQRLARFFQGLFPLFSLRRLPATASEMTAHDALRLCSGRVRDDGSHGFQHPAARPTNVYWYRSEKDLNTLWNCFNNTKRGSATFAVVLVLGDFLRSNLRDLIRRPPQTGRLVIVPQPGHWPGVDSFADVALASGSLGWNSIELCRNLRLASPPSACAAADDERLLFVLPRPACGDR